MRNTSAFNETIDIKKILGTRVLTDKGFVFGSVKEIRINPKTKVFEGIVVKRTGFGDKVYFDRTYLDKISHHAVVLNIEPSILLKGQRVISHHGESIGRIKEIIRVGKRNDIKEIIVSSLLRGRFSVKPAHIHSSGKNIILNNGYNAPKKRIWNIFRR